MSNNLKVDQDKKTVSMERVFDAPRELVWKAHTDPDLISQWWGTDQTEMVIDRMDVKVGGEWRFIHKAPDQSGQIQEFAFHGVYKEIKEPEQMTWTFNFEPIGPGHELTETIIFEDLGDGRTKISTTSHFLTAEDLDGMLKSGMETGATQSWNRLENLLQTKKEGK
jgi:uncharacterized protein YndB with AHSA1/START domain